MSSKIVVVVPTVRPESYKTFREAWDLHFKWWDCDLVTVWDGDAPQLHLNDRPLGAARDLVDEGDLDLFDYCRTDAVRNLGSYFAAKNLDFDYLVTLDDDVLPITDDPKYKDPIGDHLRVLHTKVPGSWMNTLMGVGVEFPRGTPYQVRAENTVHISHGLWTGTLDWDGITQHYLIPQAVGEPEKYRKREFYIGPVPSGIHFSFCGMHVAVTREALPLLMYCPQGPTVGYHRWGDIWMGNHLVEECAKRKWSIYTGASVINHSRASNVYKNLDAENCNGGYEINETLYKTPDDQLPPFFAEYTRKRLKYQTRMTELLGLPA